MFLLSLGAALAAEPPACDGGPVLPDGDRKAVVWLSPQRRRARMDQPLQVHPSSEVAAFVRTDPSPARLLQWTGLRRADRAPRRAWKVVVFDAPVAALSAGEACGVATDRRAGGPGAPTWVGTWRDLATDGFCVLPLARWIERQSQTSAGR